MLPLSIRHALLLVVAAAGLLFLLPRQPDRAGTAVTTDAARRVPVLVELFTSEGCSSCPPADALLSELVRSQPVAGVRIVPLALHVDYWDRLGWKDPFASADFSARQTDYQRGFKRRGGYTPQMIVNGTREFVGSDRSAALAAIAAAGRERAGDFSDWLNATAGDPRLKSDDPLELLLAETEDGLHSKVVAGENEGRELLHDGVVRSLRPLAPVPLPAGFELARAIGGAGCAKAGGPSLRRILFIQAKVSHRVVAIEPELKAACG